MKVVRLLNRYMYWRNKYFTTLRSRVHVYLQIIKIKCCWKNLHIICVFELFALIIYNWIVSTVLPSNLKMEKKFHLFPCQGEYPFMLQKSMQDMYLYIFSLFPLAGGPGMVRLWEHSTGWSWRICQVARAGRWFCRLLYNRA